MSFQLFTTKTEPNVPASPKGIYYISSADNRPYFKDETGEVLNYGPCYPSTTSASAAINTTETIVAGGNAVNGGTCLIPANFLSVGSTIRAIIHGTCTSTVSSTSTFSGRIGTMGNSNDASLFTANMTSAGSGTTIPFSAIMIFAVRTAGATGTIAGSLILINTGITGISLLAINVLPLTVSAINTTADAYFELTFKSGAATTSCTFQQGTIEIIR